MNVSVIYKAWNTPQLATFYTYKSITLNIVVVKLEVGTVA